MTTMLVEVEWTLLEEEGDPLWDCCRCLYAYVDADSGKVLYIGKADYQSVGQRMAGRHKEDVFRFFRAHGVRRFAVLHGELCLEEGRRLSSELISDVESLLIYRLRPPANINCIRSRISRPGMRVACVGDDWPDRRRRFHDRGEMVRFA